MVLFMDTYSTKHSIGPPYLDMPCAVLFVDGVIALRRIPLGRNLNIYICFSRTSTKRSSRACFQTNRQILVGGCACYTSTL